MPRHLITCFVCNSRLQSRSMRRLDGDENVAKRDVAISRRDMMGHPPLDVTNETKICFNCDRYITEELVLLAQDPMCMRINVLTQTRSASCLICQNDENVHRLSLQARVDVFITSNIYIPGNTRSCHNHLNEQGLLLKALHAGLRFINRPYVIKGEELQSFLQELRRNIVESPQQIDEDKYSDEDFEVLTSLTKGQFRDMFSFCDPIPVQTGTEYVKKKDLITFLTKLRHGVSDDFLKVVFNYPNRQSVSYIIMKVRKSLLLRFVPQNIGFAAITRQNYIQNHVTDFANTLYNPTPNNKKAIIYVDGTYAFIEKSSNFRVLRQSFSLHKNRHLIKPVLLVAPDGYILDIQGPYFADAQNNDAALLQAEFDRDVNEMREWFQAEDILIIDRGYRDVVGLLDQLDIRYYMPELLDRGQRQFTTEEANNSRLVTKTRWIVEARNGHLKSIFKFLAGIIRVPHAGNIGDFYRIAGSIINRYREPIHMANADEELAISLKEWSQQVNVVQARVEVENLHRRRIADWVRLDHEQVMDFPILTLEYLKDLTVGVYQLELAPSYIQDYLNREDDIFQVDRHAIDPGFVRFRLHSRFRNAVVHHQWIAYIPSDDDDNDDNENPIIGYYCTCK